MTALEDYLAGQQEPQRSTLDVLRARIRTVLPDAQELISYGVPGFAVDGTVVAGFGGFKNHCSYFPFSGAVCDRLADSLRGYTHNQGTLQFPVAKPLPLALVRKLIAVRLQIESEKRPKSGLTRTFYDNGRLQSKGRMRGDLMVGPWSWWRKDGTLMRTGEFTKGEQSGVWCTWDRDGCLVKETRFG